MGGKTRHLRGLINIWVLCPPTGGAPGRRRGGGKTGASYQITPPKGAKPRRAARSPGRSPTGWGRLTGAPGAAPRPQPAPQGAKPPVCGEGRRPASPRLCDKRRRRPGGGGSANRKPPVSTPGRFHGGGCQTSGAREIVACGALRGLNFNVQGRRPGALDVRLTSRADRLVLAIPLCCDPKS